MTIRTLEQTHILHLGDLASREAEKDYYALPGKDRTDEMNVACWHNALEKVGLKEVNDWAPSSKAGVPYKRIDDGAIIGKTFLTYLPGNDQLTIPTLVHHKHAAYLHEFAQQMHVALNTLPLDAHNLQVTESVVITCKTASNKAHECSMSLGLNGVPAVVKIPSSGAADDVLKEGVSVWALTGRTLHEDFIQRHSRIYAAMWGMGH